MRSSSQLPEVSAASGAERRGVRAWSLALALGTILIYWPATQCGFVNFDDDGYVTANFHVQRGVTREGVQWAFVSAVNNIWHPLTMLTYMADYQLYGLKPWGYHLTNVLLHALNAALVFVLLRRITGST